MRPAAAALALAALLPAAATGCRSALRDPGPVEALAARAAAEATDTADAEPEALLERRTEPAARAAVAAFLRRAAREPDDVEGLLGASRGWVWLGNRPGAERAADDAESAVRAGQLCLERAPDDPRCAYRLAVALGLQARERRSTALDGLDRMVELLERAATSAPELDRGGPHRVLALVRLRAPGWPAGPGDPDLGLAAARAAAAIDPDHPPNVLALAEALEAVEECAAAREAWDRAVRLAAGSGDPDAPDWREEADAGRRGFTAGACGRRPGME